MCTKVTKNTETAKLPPYLTSFMVAVARFLERSLYVGIIFYLTHLVLHIIST